MVRAAAECLSLGRNGDCHFVQGTSPMRILTLLLVIWLLGATESHAAFPSLPKFWGKEQSAATTTSAKGGSAFKKPAVLTKMSSGTKRMVKNTKNLLSPKKARKEPKLGVTSTKRAEKRQPPQQSWFGRMFDPQPTPPPRTMGEWMALEQPLP
jgi:hypothetical protein